MKNRSAILLVLLLTLAVVAFAATPVDGAWSAVNASQGAPLNLALTANGTTLTGSADGVAISGGKIAMADVWFTWVRGGVTYSYKGTVSGTSLRLVEYKADGSGGNRVLQYNHN